MKYQKLENQEANWKWIYLIRKHREGEKNYPLRRKKLRRKQSSRINRMSELS